MDSIAVLGSGGVGGFVVAALARHRPEVTVVAREPSAAALARTGITVRSTVLGDFAVRPRIVTELDDPVDALLVATKATGLDHALQLVRGEPALVLPLLNGLEHLATLRERFRTSEVAAAVIRIDSDRPAPGEIVQSSPGARVDIAGETPAVVALAQILRDAGLTVETGGAEPDVMWSKLARLCPLALTTSASDRPLGEIRSDPRWRSALDNAVAETIAVARADGAHLRADETLAELEAAHAGLGSSMQRDITAGREPELDAIAGAVLRAGARHGIRCPTIRWLAGRVAQRAGISAPAG